MRLGGITAGLAVAVALALAFAVRRKPDLLTRGVVRLASVGYAVPGAVIVVGLLLPVGWLQSVVPQWGVGALVTTTAVGIVWAYLVRFCARYSRYSKNATMSKSMVASWAAAMRLSMASQAL